MRIRHFALCLGLFLLASHRTARADTYVRFNTTLGNIDVQLFSAPGETPNTVTNFLSYIGNTDIIINRSAVTFNSNLNENVPFVVQAGAFNLIGSSINEVSFTTDYTTNPLNSEAGYHSNTRGTIAMALSTGPNSATNQWFFNEADNSFLDTGDGGPFTVFGVITDTSSLSVMDQIGSTQGAVQPSDQSTFFADLINPPNAGFGANFSSMPLFNYNSSQGLLLSNLILVNSITTLTVQTLASWQTGPNAKFTSQQQINPNFIAAGATPWNDKVPNLLKYVCDIDPSKPMTAAARANLPTAGTLSGGVLTLTYHQNSAMIGTTVNVQTSTDLQTWTTVSQPVFVQTGADSAGDPIFQVQVLASGTRQFVRLQITQP